MRLLNPNFAYKPSASTNVMETWRKHGFRPTTDEQRKAAQERLHAPQRKLKTVGK